MVTLNPDEASVRKDLTALHEATLNARIQRTLELRPQMIVPFHHFAPASTECVSLYRDGYFLATAMTTQSVNEALIKFIAERNDISPNQDPNDLVSVFEARKIVPADCIEAMRRILRSFRNDFHHLNPSLLAVPVQDIAKRNITDIALIERELFAHTFETGQIVTKHRRYWDVSPDGLVHVSLRGS
jgi:hypothetical protein